MNSISSFLSDLFLRSLIVKRFDFVEAFNSCEPVSSNSGAEKLAKKYGKVMTGGSDSHKPDCVGRGYTILPEPVTCETELISLIHKKTAVQQRANRSDRSKCFP